MRLYRSPEEVADLGGRSRSVAIGVFDGVHRGHQRIVNQAVEKARQTGGVATVVTFDPHPLTVLAPDRAPPILTLLPMKLDLLEELGASETLAIPFDREFSRLDPAAFCGHLLAGRLGAREVMVGANFRFGARAAGTPEDLIACGAVHGYAVTAIQLMEEDGGRISSTRIRALLGEGKVAEAAALLGRFHALTGYVEGGAGRGRDMGVPTANLAVPGGVVVPALGVYVTRTTVETGPPVPSITSVGTNPTFESDGKVRVETFLLDYSGNLYGRHIGVEFVGHIRGQKTFASVDSLVAQMQADIEAARAWFENRSREVGDRV